MGDKPQAGRMVYLDALRVLATCLVILLHSVSFAAANGDIFATPTWWAANALGQLGRVGVPLFFMLSGCLLLQSPKTLEIGPFYRKRLGKILPAFLAWDVIYYLLACRAGGVVPGPGGFFRELARYGSQYHLWFVYRMAAIYLILPFVKRMVDGCTRRQLWGLTGLVILPQGVFALLNEATPVYFSMKEQVMLEPYLGFVLLGYLLGTARPTRAQRLGAYALGLAALAGGVWGNYLLSTAETMAMPFSWGYSVNHYVTAGAVFLLFQAIPWPGGWVARALAEWSGATYGIYLAHILVLDWVIAHVTGPLWSIQTMLAACGWTIVIATAVMWCVSKVKYLNRALG